MSYRSSGLLLLVLVELLPSCRFQRSQIKVPRVCRVSKKDITCQGFSQSNVAKIRTGVVASREANKSLGLIFNAKDVKFCSGVFVSPRLMLTASTCLTALDLNNPELYLVSPDPQYNKGGQKFSIVQKAKHFTEATKPIRRANAKFEDFSKFEFGLAMIDFERNMIMKSDVAEISRERLGSGDLLTWVGYGLPGIEATEDLWLRKNHKKLLTSIYSPRLLEVAESFGVRSYMHADRENLAEVAGGGLFYKGYLIGISSGFSFRHFAYFWKSDRRFLFTNLLEGPNLEFIEATLVENTRVQY